ncbi:MAG: hypothetical protein AAFN77_17960 [Planctomycetota bacterium]
MSNQVFHVVVLDKDGVFAGRLTDAEVSTLVGIVSEDPADWSEMQLLWPRFRTPAVPEFASNMPMEVTDRAIALAPISETGDWYVFDLIEKRMLSGTGATQFGSGGQFDLLTSDQSENGGMISVIKPKWWEFHELVQDASGLEQHRESPFVKPSVDRDFFYGPPLIRFLASRMIEVSHADRWDECQQGRQSRTDPFYALTIEIHRDWLMTPREELNGKTPRDILHHGRRWVEDLIHAQKCREAYDASLSIVALPKETSCYLTGPMGREEFIMYHDLCRHLTEAGLAWCRNVLPSLDPMCSESGRLELLLEFLSEQKTDWLKTPIGGGDETPEWIIACNRHRVPRFMSPQAFIGLEKPQVEPDTDHDDDECDCPICIMMASGAFGPSFVGFDGHHLELDEEFAFSMHTSFEDWEEEQKMWALEFEDWNDEQESESQLNKRVESALDVNGGEFTSIWGPRSATTPIAGDPTGQLHLAFLLTDIISDFDPKTERELIKDVNQRFVDFRISNNETKMLTVAALNMTLERMAQRQPELTAKIADFQSLLLESARETVA